MNSDAPNKIDIDELASLLAQAKKPCECGFLRRNFAQCSDCQCDLTPLQKKTGSTLKWAFQCSCAGVGGFAVTHAGCLAMVALGGLTGAFSGAAQDKLTYGMLSGWAATSIGLGLWMKYDKYASNIRKSIIGGLAGLGFMTAIGMHSLSYIDPFQVPPATWEKIPSPLQKILLSSGLCEAPRI